MEPYNIRRRKAEEARLETAMAAISQRKEAQKMTHFENRTSAKAGARMAKEEMRRAEQELKQGLLRRRAKLAQLLERERQDLERMIEASFDPPEVVKAKMFAKARALQERREEERRQKAAELDALRFKQGSDLLRARNSMITAHRAADERARQIAEHQQRLAEEREREAEEDRKMAERLKVSDEREEREAAERARRNAEMRAELDAQVGVKKSLESRRRRHEAEVDGHFLGLWQREARDLDEKERARRARARAEMKRTMKENEQYRGKEAKAAAQEFAEDQARLQAVLDREADEDRRERETMEARKAEMIRHQKELEAQMALEAEAGDKYDAYFQEY